MPCFAGSYTRFLRFFRFLLLIFPDGCQNRYLLIVDVLAYHGAYSLFVAILDILVDGRFVDELRDPALRFRGSSNQRIIDVKKTLAAGEIVLAME